MGTFLFFVRRLCKQRCRLFLCTTVVQTIRLTLCLHNRKTLEMCLDSLSPAESGLFIPKRSVKEKALLYMCLGGVPKYLEQVDPKWSVEKNLNRLCFSADGFFVSEYETLFKEQFRSFKVYESVVSELAMAPASLSELGRRIGVARGGGFGEQLQNLVRAQFVREYTPVRIGKSAGVRTRQYKLVDPFLLFYFRYIHDNRAVISLNQSGENLFRSIVGSSRDSYCGFAFERLGEAAIHRILFSLDLSLADVVRMGPYFRQARTRGEGVQVDWLILRRDGVWNVLEFKYLNKPAGLSVMHDVIEKIRRLDVPPEVTIEPVLVSAMGGTKALVGSGFFSHILTLEDLLT